MDGPLTGALLAERYRLGPSLGAGGMGAVYRAHDELLGDDVALKVLLSADRSAMQRMREEVRLARRVTHRNVARTFDLGMHDGRPFVTMELLEGASLRDVLRQARGADRTIVGLLAQVADGLVTAHRAGVVHRDLKPSNVMVVTAHRDAEDFSGPRAVLIDFGVSTAVGEGSDGVSGTLDYMSPEQLRGEATGAPSDVFALGVLVFHALSGRFPYAGASAAERAVARVQVAPDLRALFDAPIALGEIVGACLAESPRDRPPADEVAVALRDWLSTEADVALSHRTSPALEAGDATTAFLSLRAPRAAHTLPSAQRDRILAVAPFAPVGAGLARTLAGAISTHVVERLCRARGLLVASSTFFDGVDAAAARARARAARIDLLVEGTLEVSPETGAVVEIRLIDLHGGATLLSRTVTSPVEGLLGVGADLAGRIAEALRVELEIATTAEAFPPRVVELYLEARQALRRPELGRSGVARVFDECLALAPGFVPAKVARALALARIYSFANQRTDAEDEVVAAVRDAEAVAPDAPDTCAARGAYELQVGHLRSAIAAFTRTLELAPTHPFALEQLGRIACEAGRTREGITRLELAATLDPLAQTSLCLVARSAALRGRLEDYQAVMQRIREKDVRFLEVARLELRVADWYGDPTVAERILTEWPDARPPDTSSAVISLASVVAGRPDGMTRFEEMERVVFANPLSPRFRAVVLQASAELRARRDPPRALALIEECVSLPFFDIEWLELCPVLDGLRDDPRFLAAQRTVRDRVSAVWEDTTSIR